MHRIYREVLNPKGQNHDEIHGYVVDLMVQTHSKKGTSKLLDLSDFLWNEIFIDMINRKVPPFAPYMMKLISVRCS